MAQAVHFLSVFLYPSPVSPPSALLAPIILSSWKLTFRMVSCQRLMPQQALGPQAGHQQGKAIYIYYLFLSCYSKDFAPCYEAWHLAGKKRRFVWIGVSFSNPWLYSAYVVNCFFWDLSIYVFLLWSIYTLSVWIDTQMPWALDTSRNIHLKKRSKGEAM